MQKAVHVFIGVTSEPKLATSYHESQSRRDSGDAPLLSRCRYPLVLCSIPCVSAIFVFDAKRSVRHDPLQL